MVFKPSDVAEYVFLAAIAAITFSLSRIFVPYLNRMLVDVKLKDAGVALVFGKFLAMRVVRYERIASVREISFAELKREVRQDGASVWGVIGRNTRFVVIAAMIVQAC